jgi:hypothetical protein
LPRHFNPDLIIPWKLSMPATTAGRVSAALLDPVHQKTIYGARVKLVDELLRWWLAREAGTPSDQLPHVSSIFELRSNPLLANTEV